MNFLSIGERVRWCVLIHVRIESARVSAVECAVVGDRHSKVGLGIRWTRQSCMYCVYVTVHGPRPLSAMGKRRLLL